jgi:oligopeptide/dipeptide ABC transporter ATP-binding protein
MMKTTELPLRMKGSDAGAHGTPVLDVRDLRVHFDLHNGRRVQAVDGVSFVLDASRTLGIVGESGSGKTTIVRAVLRIVDAPGAIGGGQVIFQGQDLLTLSDEQMRRLRSRRIAMIFQNPAGSLDPLFTIGDQFVETIRIHTGLNRRQALARAKEALDLVGIADPASVIASFPTYFNAGMIQRIMIGMAISCEPDLILADEPTTTLGVLAQAQILNALLGIQERLGTAILLITHDMGVVSHVADDILVMYAGRCVEYGAKEQVLLNPRHPYTVGLMGSVPAIDQARSSRLRTIPGFPPDLSALPAGCPFAPRCYRKPPIADVVRPELVEVEPGHWVACHSPVPPEERAVLAHG